MLKFFLNNYFLENKYGKENIINADQEKILITWLKNNGIESAIEDCPPKNRKVYIGLRRDLRDDIKLCFCLLKTIIYFLEGRLDIPLEYKIGDIKNYK